MIMITICLSFFNQNDMLKFHIETWKNYSDEIKSKVKFSIVDDCSKTHIEDIISEEMIKGIDIKIYRVHDDLICNIAGVRNLAAKECQTEWMIILDMDTVIPEESIKQIIELAEKNEKDVAYKFNRKVPNKPKHEKNNKPHPAVCLIRKSDYWKAGGCEEDLVGHYGSTDPSFWWKARKFINIKNESQIFLDYYTEGEADIIRDKSHNIALIERKKKDNLWSTDFIRFKWSNVSTDSGY